jgi:hypothetical protein
VAIELAFWAQRSSIQNITNFTKKEIPYVKSFINPLLKGTSVSKGKI